MRIKDIVKLTTKSIIPNHETMYHLYSLPSFDENQNFEVLSGEEIQSNKFIVPDKCILFISVPLKSGQININQTIPEKGKN